MRGIIHLSDLHVGYKDCSNKLLSLINNIKKNYIPASNYVVVVTGDIVENARIETAYEEARSLLKRLEDSGYSVLVVPGNHDYGNGIKGSERYVARFKKAFYDDETMSYPKLDIIGDIAFVGLDSMAATFDWLDVWGADGELGELQRNALAELLNANLLSDKKKLVYLHHHPFDGKGRLHRLEDSKAFKEIVAGRIDCLLFGHNHAGKDYCGYWDIPHCYDGSSSTGKDDKSATPIRVIHL